MKLLLILFIAVFATGSYSNENAQSIYKKYSDKIVFIESNNGVGTGFELEPNLYVTNRHVVFGFNSETGKWNAPKKLILKNGKVLDNYGLLICSVRVDICFISTNEATVKSSQLKLTNRKLSPGEDVFVIGHPSGVGAPIISTGIISSEHNMILWDNIWGKEARFLGFTTNAAISQGSSGSPLISKNGELLGIIVGYLKNSQNLNLVISTNEINNFIEQLKQLNKEEVVVFKMGFDDEFEKATKKLAQEKTFSKTSDENLKLNESTVAGIPENKINQPTENSFPITTPESSSGVNSQANTDPNQIRNIIRDNITTFKKCYQDDLNSLPVKELAFKDTVYLKFKISPLGIPTDAMITSESVPSSTLKQCLISTIESMRFAGNSSGRIVEVNQPLNLSPKKI